MAEHVFSAARLRGYRVLEDAGLGDAVALQVLDTLVASRLWLPFSLIEIAFRNAADRTIADAHQREEDWLIASGRDGEELVAADVTGPTELCSVRYDGAPDDPVAEAAHMAGRQLGRARILRDDLIAHLMLGFWVHRCPEGLSRQDPRVDVWEVIAASLGSPLNDAEHLEKVMTQLLRTRNRVAHHEPLLFRAKHVFSKSGEPKIGADLVTSLQSAIEAFTRDVHLTVETAKTIAPMASKYVEAAPDLIRVDIAALEGALTAERLRLREAREARLAARQAERDSRFGRDVT